MHRWRLSTFICTLSACGAEIGARARCVDLFEEQHAYSSRVNDVRLKAMGHAVVMHLPCNVANLLLYCRRRKIMHDNKYQRARTQADAVALCARRARDSPCAVRSLAWREHQALLYYKSCWCGEANKWQIATSTSIF